MALRARFVGGRGSCSPGGGLVLERTAAVVVAARWCFVLCTGGEEGAGVVVALGSSGMDELMPLRIESRQEQPKPLHFIYLKP